METHPQSIDSTSNKEYFLLILIFLGMMKVYYWICRDIALLIYPPDQHSIADQLGTEIGMLIRCIPIILFYWINRDHLKQYFITRDFSRNTALILLIVHFTILFLAIIYAILETGNVSIYPINDWAELLFFPIYISILEELEFRSIMFVKISQFLSQYYPVEIAEYRTMILIILWFGPIYHLRHFMDGNFLLYVIVILFGFFTTYLTAKTCKILPAIILHISLNFYFVIFVT
ncbi:MAG: CPBP family intramembrane glutamic endopeptidase [Candidatus Hermodarchaeota archaeon]